MMSTDPSQSISLNVLVEKDKKRVVFVESNWDFVDLLFSFMTMPIGNIIKLAREQSQQDNFGCLNNLYQSIEILHEKHLQRGMCKDLLLRPRSAAEIYFRNLKLNFVDTNDIYVCCAENIHNPTYNYKVPTYQCFGLYYNARCLCGLTMNTLHKIDNRPSVPEGGVFVKPTARFMITDDFQVKPISTTTCVDLLSKYGAAREEMTINIGRDAVIKLLSCSLTTKAPFSETILDLETDKSSSLIDSENYGPRSTNQPERAMDATKKETMITLKLIVNKSKNKALYVEAREDFVNLIGSFLTFPLGLMFEKLSCSSMRGCLGNLYKSIQDLDVNEFLQSEEMKAILVNPKLARGLALPEQLIPIEEASYPSYSTASSLFNISSGGGRTCPVDAITGKGYFREPSLFMVTDDLTVTPLSPMSIVHFIDTSKIPVSDISEQKVTIGEEEALRLLEAALLSKTALTDLFYLKGKKTDTQ